MPQAILLPSADDDLAEIWEFIARNSPENARRMIERIINFCDDTLAYSPLIGRSRNELVSGLRSYPIGSYVIFYRPIAEGVEVLRILHGSRDIQSIFEQDS